MFASLPIHSQNDIKAITVKSTHVDPPNFRFLFTMRNLEDICYRKYK